MPFKKGISGNAKGRPLGSPNKNKALIHSFMTLELENNLIRFKTEIDKLNGKEFINVFLQMCKVVGSENSFIVANNKIIDIINKIK